MLISELPELVGYLLGSFALGYAASWTWYIFRRVAWQST